jgi:hypothetical protein
MGKQGAGQGDAEEEEEEPAWVELCSSIPAEMSLSIALQYRTAQHSAGQEPQEELRQVL